MKERKSRCMYNITVHLIYKITLVSKKQLCCNVLHKLAVLHRGKRAIYFFFSEKIKTATVNSSKHAYFFD